MSDLPPGWANAKLSDLIARDGVFADGDWIESKDQDPSGPIRLLQLADIGDGVFVDKSNRFINEQTFDRLRCTAVIPDDVLIARMPDPLGRACLAPQSAQKRITVVDVAIVRPGAGSVIPSWLMHVINAPPIRGVIERESTGTTRRRIARGKLALLSLLVPPVGEQRRISRKVDSVVSRINSCRARLDRVPQILKKFREAVLEAAVSGRLTEEWRTLSASRTAVDGSRDLPVGWAHTTFAEITESSLYGPRFSSEDYIKDGVPTLRTTDMDVIGNIVPRDPPCVKISAADFERLGLRDGDLVITRTGATIGKCAVYDASLGPALPSAYLIRFRLRQSQVVPRFALIFLLSPNGQQLLAAGSTSFAQPNINAQKVRMFGIRLPTPLEQTEIVRRVEELFALADGITRRYDDALARVEKVTPSVLAKAFRGELVPQDPNDEPAAGMLGRIKEERKEPKVKKKTMVVRRTGRSAIVEAPDQVEAVGRIERHILTPILKKRGRMAPEKLLDSSGLSIDDFYDQLKLEESKGLLKEVRKGKDQIDRWIEAVK